MVTERWSAAALMRNEYWVSGWKWRREIRLSRLREEKMRMFVRRWQVLACRLIGMRESCRDERKGGAGVADKKTSGQVSGMHMDR